MNRNIRLTAIGLFMRPQCYLVKPTLNLGALDNYRPISKLPFRSKILEKLVSKQLCDHVRMNDLYENFQSWFRVNNSTETALDEVTNDLSSIVPQVVSVLQKVIIYGCTLSFTWFVGTVRIKVIKKNLTWEQAYDYCKDKHSRLLQIEDAEDELAVEQWLKMTENDGNNVFWIALRQSRVFGFWIWSDKMVDYNNWKNEEIPQMPMSENCGVIEKDNQSWRWRDENCLLPLPFLCEEDILYMT